MLEFKGLEELGAKLSRIKNMQAAKNIVKTNGAELNSKMVRNAVFTKGYSTGQTRRSITLEIRNDGTAAHVKPTTEYAPYLEYGTRYMSAQPFVGPAFNAQKEIFKSDLRELVD